MTTKEKERLTLLIYISYAWNHKLYRDGMTLPFVFKLFCDLSNETIEYTRENFLKLVFPLIQNYMFMYSCGEVNNLVMGSPLTTFTEQELKARQKFNGERLCGDKYEDALDAIDAGTFNWDWEWDYDEYDDEHDEPEGNGGWNTDTELLDTVCNTVATLKYTPPSPQHEPGLLGFLAPLKEY